MAGLYLHIPFCKQACNYCNFHFSTSLKLKEPLLQAMLRELDVQQHYLRGATLHSIYLGGGTPSLLSIEEINQLLAKIAALHPIATDAEITLEANPDDLSPQKLRALKQDTAINRLSIGIQSFSEEDLRFMNRAHSARESRACIEAAIKAGFTSLTIDLIYGTPTTSHQQWEENLQQVFDYRLPHLSSYCLTVEPGTALAHQVQRGKSRPVQDEHAQTQFEILVDRCEAEGYEHYEISNFARNGQYARHNSSYWLGTPYLGIGPAAHSYDGHSRQWNIAHNPRYIKLLESSGTQAPEALYTQEQLSAVQRYNEYLLTRLRTRWGCLPQDIAPQFRDRFLRDVQPYLQQGSIEQVDGSYRLTRKGKFIADRITMELFLEED